MTLVTETSFFRRALVAAGAVFSGLAIALSAYASHAADGAAKTSLFVAAALALAHGIALCALVPQALRRLGLIALAGLLLGTLLFSGGIVFRHFAGYSLGLTPFGGGLMIVSWLVYAVDALKRDY
ncbi:DUF423 domain-containing protein [Lysobacter tyrosinilyticus]